MKVRVAKGCFVSEAPLVVDGQDQTSLRGSKGWTFFATEDTESTRWPSPHDLRLTATTFMVAAGEMDEVVLSHSQQGIISVYNQFKYDAQKQSALEAWGRKVTTSIINGTQSRVVVMQHKVLITSLSAPNYKLLPLLTPKANP